VVYGLLCAWTAFILNRSRLEAGKRGLPRTVKSACLLVAFVFSFRGVISGIFRLALVHCNGIASYLAVDFILGITGHPTRFIIYSLLGSWWANIASGDLKKMGRIATGKSKVAIIVFNILIYVIWIAAWAVNVQAERFGSVAKLYFAMNVIFLILEFSLAVFFCTTGVMLIRSLRASDLLDGKSSTNWRAAAMRKTSNQIISISAAIVLIVGCLIPVTFFEQTIALQVFGSGGSYYAMCEWFFFGLREIPSSIWLALVVFPFSTRSSAPGDKGRSTTTSTASNSSSSDNSSSSESSSVELSSASSSS
jgi:hypothetical protein